ncbi:MAG: hypothetical protein OEU86_09240 [Gammaproteobacteria bacterium]|nr:hypothetical protein [Gammaproteobacteria bacterium]
MDTLKNHFLHCCFLIALLLSSASMSGEAEGRITKVQILTNSKSVVFTIAGEIQDPASCNKWQTFAVTLPTTTGQAIFEIVKQAFLKELVVEVKGLGTCTSHWRSEDVKYITVKK